MTGDGRRTVIKLHKRLWVTDAAGRPDYTPPEFVKIRTRADMHALAEDMERRGRLPAIMDFKDRFTKRGRTL